MNYHEEDPDHLGGLGSMLPADVLKELNRLLAWLHQVDLKNFGSHINLIDVSADAQYVGHIETQYFGGHSQQLNEAPQPPATKENTKDNLPAVLSTEEAMALWQKAQEAGYIDDNYQPRISRTQAALLVDAMSERLGIKEKWKVFETLWNRKNMYRDYYKALNLQQSLAFQDEIKILFR